MKQLTKDELLDYIDGLIARAGVDKLQPYAQLKEIVENCFNADDLLAKIGEKIKQQKPKVSREEFEETIAYLKMNYMPTHSISIKNLAGFCELVLDEYNVNILEVTDE